MLPAELPAASISVISAKMWCHKLQKDNLNDLSRDTRGAQQQLTPCHCTRRHHSKHIHACTLCRGVERGGAGDRMCFRGDNSQKISSAGLTHRPGVGELVHVNTQLVPRMGPHNIVLGQLDSHLVGQVIIQTPAFVDICQLIQLMQPCLQGPAKRQLPGDKLGRDRCRCTVAFAGPLDTTSTMANGMVSVTDVSH